MLELFFFFRVSHGFYIQGYCTLEFLVGPQNPTRSLGAKDYRSSGAKAHRAGRGVGRDEEWVNPSIRGWAGSSRASTEFLEARYPRP